MKILFEIRIHSNFLQEWIISTKIFMVILLIVLPLYNTILTTSLENIHYTCSFFFPYDLVLLKTAFVIQNLLHERAMWLEYLISNFYIIDVLCYISPPSQQQTKLDVVLMVTKNKDFVAIPLPQQKFWEVIKELGRCLGNISCWYVLSNK